MIKRVQQDWRGLAGLAGMTLMLGTGTVAAQWAGSLNPPGPADADNQMYTLGDLYDRLSTGATGIKAGTFTEPAAGPGSSGPTLNEVMAAMPTVDDTQGAAAAEVLNGQKFWSLRSGAGVWGGPRTGTMANRGAFSLTCGTGNQTVDAGYYSGGTLAGDGFLTQANIVKDVTIFGVTGTAVVATGDATNADVLVTKTFSNATTAGVAGNMANRGAFSLTCGTGNQTVDAGYYSGGTLAGDSALTAANIKSGVILFGVTGTYAGTTCTGTAVAADVLSSKTFSNGVGIGLSGIMPNITTDQASTAQGAGTGVITLTAPQGYYDGSDKVTATDARVAALDADITQANIKKDVTIFGVTGTYEPAPCTCSSTPTNGRWCANGDGTVTDLLGATVSGKVRGRCLVWLQNANCSATLATINKNPRLNWSDAVIWSSAVKAGDCGLIALEGSVEGDWRLPTKVELQALATDSSAGDKISFASATPFTGVQDIWYWSSTTRATTSVDAWAMLLINGGVVDVNGKGNAESVWPVRGGL